MRRTRTRPLAVCIFLVLLTNRSFAASISFQNAIQADSPILWYQLNEAAGNAINYGSLGATHDATYNGTINREVGTLAGDTGVGFDSSDDFLESLGVSNLTGNPTFSIETLVFLPTDGTAALWGPFLHWGIGGTGQEVYFSVANNNLDRIYAGFYCAGQRTANTVPLGEWLHIVWTRQGENDSATGTILYINGASVTLEQDPDLVLVGCASGFLPSRQITVTSTEFRINRGQDFIGGRFFTGTMDEIALYDRVLTPLEVQEHFNLASCPWDCADGDGNVGVVDFLALLAQWGQVGTSCDYDGGGVGCPDFVDLLANWGPCP